MGVTAASPARSRRPRLLAASVALYRAGARLLRAVPARVRYAAAGPGGTAWFWFSPAQRHAALDNYAAALGRDRRDPEVARVARRAFQNYGRMLMDFLLLDSLTPAEVISRVTVDGREHLDGAVSRGRGVIVAVPHMGSWDMGGSFGGAVGYPVLAVVETFPGSLNDAVVETRQRFGVKVVAMGRQAVRAINDALAANGVVTLVCDLEQGPGVTVSFFGRQATVPAGPAAFALKTGATILPGAVHSTAPGRYNVHLDPALELHEGDTKESVMQRVIGRFEDFIKEHPDQWYAFRPMFTR